MRFYEKVLSKPIPIGILVLGFIIVNPFHIPPDPIAQAVEVVEAPVLVERTPEASKAYAKTQLSKFGWDTPAQWECLLSLWTKESNWRPDAYNKTPVYQQGKGLNAGGIPQILGLDPDTTVERQIERGFIYLDTRYGSICSAWRFWSSHYWY